jgi:hypothetical protein
MRHGLKIGGTIVKISTGIDGTIGEGGTRQVIEDCNEFDVAPR